MRKGFSESYPLPEFSLWEKMKRASNLISFELEVTGRCNNNCGHCYINLPAGSHAAKAEELDIRQIQKISDEAVSLGAMWCLITGGEPLLREDFFDIYLYLKKIGLLVSVFTNATLINAEHIALFKKYPPRDIEITVYGITRDTYERVTRKKGSYDAFKAGVELLLKNRVNVRFKAMALRSNVHELQAISDYCQSVTKDYFRFDPFLHLRLDRDLKRNDEIKRERLRPEEIVAIERNAPDRFKALEKVCQKMAKHDFKCNHLFHCGVGVGSVTISYNGFLRLCSSLCHQDCVSSLAHNSLKDAWQDLFLKVRNMRSNRKEFLEKCRKCDITDLCMWCPARAYLETHELDKPVEYFCEVAHARVAALKKK